MGVGPGNGKSSVIEREVKLGAWPGLALPDLTEVVPGAGVTRLPALRQSAIYYDTVDLRLARSGVTVRYRSSVSIGVAGERVPDSVELPWTVKLPGPTAPLPGGGVARHELGFAGHEGRIPTAVSQLVRGITRSAPLVAVARLRTDRQRTQVLDRAGLPVAEIDDDEVSVLVPGANGRSRRVATRFRELEVELADGGDPEALQLIVDRLRGAGAGTPDPTPKVMRALGPRALDPPDVVVLTIGKRATAGEVVRSAIATSAAALIAHDPGVRLGDDPEDVHKGRVATRRLRSDLRTFAPLLDGDWVRSLRDELGWIAALLGDVRDTDVLLERLHRHAAALPEEDARAANELIRRLGDHRDQARALLLEAMDSPRYTNLLDRVVEAARTPLFAAGSTASTPLTGAVEAAGAEVPPPVLAATAFATATTLAAAAATAGASAVATPRDGAEPAGAVGPGRTGWPPGELGGDVLRGEVLGGEWPPSLAPGRDADRVVPVAAGPALTPGQPVGPFARDVGRWPGFQVGTPPPTPGGLQQGPPTLPTPGGSQQGPPTPPAPRLADQPALEVLPGLVKRPWRHLEHAVTALGDDPVDDDLHRIRILAKRCRYAAEAVAPVVGERARALAEAVAEIQGVLGDFHDAIVAEEWLRDAAVGATPAQALAAGQMITLERQEAQAGRVGWKASWKRASARKLRTWLDRA